MNATMEKSMNVSLWYGFRVLVLQSTGILSGLIIMFFMSRYGPEIQFSWSRSIKLDSSNYFWRLLPTPGAIFVDVPVDWMGFVAIGNFFEYWNDHVKYSWTRWPRLLSALLTYCSCWIALSVKQKKKERSQWELNPGRLNEMLKALTTIPTFSAFHFTLRQHHTALTLSLLVARHQLVR